MKYRLKVISPGYYRIQSKGILFGWNDFYACDWTYETAKRLLNKLILKEEYKNTPRYIYPPLPEKEPTR